MRRATSPIILVRAVEQGREEVRVSARRVIPRPDDGAAVHVA